MAAKLGELAAIRPKTDVIPIVRLNAHRRPKMSPEMVTVFLIAYQVAL